MFFSRKRKETKRLQEEARKQAEKDAKEARNNLSIQLTENGRRVSDGSAAGHQPEPANEFSPEILPDPRYPGLVRYVMAACFYDDVLADRLPDYGVDTTELDDGIAQNHSLTLLRMLEGVSAEFAPTHQAILGFALSRMHRIYLQLERRHSNNLNEQLQLGSQIMSTRESEEAALAALQRQLREFSKHYGNHSLGVIGFVPSILTALGLEYLTQPTSTGSVNERERAPGRFSEHQDEFDLTMVPFPEYGELVRTAFAGCLYFDTTQPPLEDYGVHRHRLSDADYRRNDASLDVLSQLGFERPEVARIHAPIYNYIRARTHRINCQFLSTSGKDQALREYSHANIPQAQDHETNMLVALRKEVRDFGASFGTQHLETIGLSNSVLGNLGLEDVCHAPTAPSSRSVFPPRAPDRSGQFRTLVDNILTVALEYIPLAKRPRQREYSTLDMVPIMAGEGMLERFEREFTDESPALRSFYNALVVFARARIKLFGYQDVVFLSEVDLRHRSYIPADVSLDDLRIDDREMRTWLHVVLSHLARQYGDDFVSGLGISPEHLRALGLPDLALG